MKLNKKTVAEILALAGQQKPKTKRSKFGNKKCVYDGKAFDSLHERDRYILLKALESGGKIANLRTQVSIACVVNGTKVCDYVADFVYERDGVEVVEDAKGVKTAIYRLKKKLVKASTGIDIVEVYRNRKKSA